MVAGVVVARGDHAGELGGDRFELDRFLFDGVIHRAHHIELDETCRDAAMLSAVVALRFRDRSVHKRLVIFDLIRECIRVIIIESDDYVIDQRIGLKRHGID